MLTKLGILTSIILHIIVRSHLVIVYYFITINDLTYFRSRRISDKPSNLFVFPFLFSEKVKSNGGVTGTK